MLKLEENKLILSSELVALLGATPGDRIDIEYASKNGNLIPVIVLGEKGNILTKSLTVSFKGVQKEMLLQFGDEFTAVKGEDAIELQGNKENVIFTAVSKATTEQPLDKSVILDTNYNIQKFETYEL